MVQDKLTCFIIDDDKISLRILQALVEKTNFLELKGVFDNSLEAFKVLIEQDIDLLFLDVEMPDMTGLELLATIEQRPQIILTTSKPQYAVDAFEYEVADFLLKPIINYARFLKAVRKAKANYDKLNNLTVLNDNKNGSEQIFIKVDSLLVNFNLKDIQYIEASGDYVKIYCDSKPVIVHCKLRTVEERLPPSDFLRVHRSFIVRLDKVKNIDNNNLQIENTIIPISTSYRNKLLNSIKTLS